MQGFSAPAFESISGGLGHLECSTGLDDTETRNATYPCRWSGL